MVMGPGAWQGRYSTAGLDTGTVSWVEDTTRRKKVHVHRLDQVGLYVSGACTAVSVQSPSAADGKAPEADGSTTRRGNAGTYRLADEGAR